MSRVTPSGRAVVEQGGCERVFEPDGLERKGGYSRTRLESLSPEIEAEIAHSARSIAAFRRLGDVLEAAERWTREARPKWGSDTAELDAVERAERLAAAVEEIIKTPVSG